MNPSDPLSSLTDALRSKTRRADVQQLFDVLQRDAPALSPTFTNSLDMKFVLIPSGSFHMGSLPEQAHARPNEFPTHEVHLTHAYYMAATPVTQMQYQKVVGANPSRFQGAAGGGLPHPVEQVTWDDAVRFCRALSNRPDEHALKRSYRLPTEAEWECACRAGTRTLFSSGDSLGAALANCDGRFPVAADIAANMGQTTPVGRYAPNNFGLFDMHGNVWEWCQDWYGERYYADSPPRDPSGPATGKYRIVRGGSWRSHAATCRSAYRNALAPHNRDAFTGFRVVAVLAGS